MRIRGVAFEKKGRRRRVAVSQDGCVPLERHAEHKLQIAPADVDVADGVRVGVRSTRTRRMPRLTPPGLWTVGVIKHVGRIGPKFSLVRTSTPFNSQKAYPVRSLAWEVSKQPPTIG